MKTKIALQYFMAVMLFIASSCHKDNQIIDKPITNLELSLSSDYMEVGQTDSLALIIYPQDPTNQNITYNSSDTSVVTVNNGCSEGRCTRKSHNNGIRQGE